MGGKAAMMVMRILHSMTIRRKHVTIDDIFLLILDAILQMEETPL